MSALPQPIVETNEVPKLGQLVEVRKRLWTVTEIQPSSVKGREEHLITLVSIDVEEYGSNQTIKVLWEVEPGREIKETAGLPKLDGWDIRDKVSAFLDAMRWGAAVNADRLFLQSPFRSGIQIRDYQLDPLVRAVDMSRVRLLIADDVGFGKTIETGLVIQEMIQRHRARSVLIVVPSSLQLKWQDEMQNRFGLEFRIVDTDYIKKMRRERGLKANPWTSYPRLITSMDWMKTREGLRQIKDALPAQIGYPRKFDVLVVDEAHNVSPSGTARYAIPSLRTQLIRTIGPHFEHRLFLSATPHNGYKESFTALLELMDDQRFARGVDPPEKQRQRTIVRRLKKDLPGFPERRLHPLKVSYDERELNAHALFKRYAKLRSKTDTEEGGKKDNYASDFILKLLKKRLFSSPRAFATTLQKHRETLAGRVQQETGRLEERILRSAIQKAEEDYADESRAEEATEDAVALAAETLQETPEQKEVLDELSSWASQAMNKPDSKAQAILDWLEEHLKDDGKLNNNRVILFTEYRDTLAWLFEILASSNWGGKLLNQFHGGTDVDEREKIKKMFQGAPSEENPVRILLATDAASEGIDLQKFCHYMIHVEVPWNPNVMEQRNGRIDRFGQKQDEVHIWHPVGSKIPDENLNPDASTSELDGDLEFLMILAKKVNQQREDLGSLAPVLIKQVEEIMLGKRKDLDTRDAEKKAATANKMMAAERDLKKRIESLHARVEQTKKDFRLSPERVYRAVSVALEIAGKPPLEATRIEGIDEDVYKVAMMAGPWAKVTDGLAHPIKNYQRPITFNHNVVEGRDDVVLAHLEHNLVKMCLSNLRSEVWASEDNKKLHRISVRQLPKGMVTEPQVIVFSRLVITGGEHHRLHEEITFSGGELKASGFARERTLKNIENLLDSAHVIDPSQELFDELRGRFTKNQDNIIKASNARSKERYDSLINTLEIRRKREVDDIEKVLDELEKMIKKEIEEAAEPEQLLLDGYGVDEREQIKRDVDALRARLKRIPEERKEDVKNLNRRYLYPDKRTFPIAIQFLVPEEMVK